jgi:hypothetical protein
MREKEKGVIRNGKGIELEGVGTGYLRGGEEEDEERSPLLPVFSLLRTARISSY